MITQKELKEILEYDPDTGGFVWINPKPRSGLKPGDKAGYQQKSGYVCIRINGKGYKAHRLAYLYMVGVFPDDQLDHRNRVRHDNSWDNLRDSTPLFNQRNRTTNKNNTSGISGVVWREKRGGFWECWIKTEGVKKYLGLSIDKFEAACIRKSAEIREWGRSPIQIS